MRPPGTVPSVFEESLRYLLKRLEGDASEEAQRLRREARILEMSFALWRIEVPKDSIRLQCVNELFALYRETMTYLINTKKGAST